MSLIDDNKAKILNWRKECRAWADNDLGLVVG